MFAGIAVNIVNRINIATAHSGNGYVTSIVINAIDNGILNVIASILIHLYHINANVNNEAYIKNANAINHIDQYGTTSSSVHVGSKYIYITKAGTAINTSANNAFTHPSYFLILLL